MKETLQLTLCTYTKLSPPVSVYCTGEGEGAGWEAEGSSPSAGCMYVSVALNFIMTYDFKAPIKVCLKKQSYQILEKNQICDTAMHVLLH